MKLTTEEIVEILNRYEINEIADNYISSLRYEELGEKFGEPTSKDFYNSFLHNEKLGNYEFVYEVGDCEGGGEYSCKVIHFTDHDVYIKVEGSYYSHDGTYWESFKPVTPKEKTITVYE